MTTTANANDTTPPVATDDLPAALRRSIELHLQGYAEPNPARRAALVEAAWDPDGELFDPPFDGTGHAAIAALTDVVLAHYPAHRFVRTTDVDVHHRFARYGWALVAPDGTEAVQGIDVAEAGDDGRLRRTVGFFGALATRAD